MAQTANQTVETSEKNNGPVAAIFIAGGVASAVLGLIVPISEAIPAFKTSLAWNAGVGPLTGKVIIPSVLFFIVWAVLGYLFKDKNVKLRNALTIAFVGIIIGLLGTFPPVFEMFTAH